MRRFAVQTHVGHGVQPLARGDIEGAQAAGKLQSGRLPIFRLSMMRAPGGHRSLPAVQSRKARNACRGCLIQSKPGNCCRFRCSANSAAWTSESNPWPRWTFSSLIRSIGRCRRSPLLGHCILRAYPHLGSAKTMVVGSQFAPKWSHFLNIMEAQFCFLNWFSRMMYRARFNF